MKIDHSYPETVSLCLPGSGPRLVVVDENENDGLVTFSG